MLTICGCNSQKDWKDSSGVIKLLLRFRGGPPKDRGGGSKYAFVIKWSRASDPPEKTTPENWDISFVHACKHVTWIHVWIHACMEDPCIDPCMDPCMYACMDPSGAI